MTSNHGVCFIKLFSLSCKNTMMNAADSKHVYLINTELPHTVLDVIYLYLCLDS